MWPFNKKEAHGFIPVAVPSSEEKAKKYTEADLRAVKKAALRAYAGAQLNRLTTDWVASGASADSEVRGALTLLRNRSRQLFRDNDYVKGFNREVKNNVVGQGIPFQAQVRMQRGGKLDETKNALIEEAWTEWCKKKHCHTAGTLNFDDIERLLIGAVAQDGEIFVRFIYRSFGGSRVPFALEIIEADRVDENRNGKASNGNDIRMGVEIDSWGRHVAYYVRTRHPGDFNVVGGRIHGVEIMRIPADEMIPLGIIERAGQTRCVPWIHSAMIRLHHLHGYEESEVIAARAGASLMGFIKSPEGELKGDAVQDGERVTDFQPGLWKYLADGEEPVVPDLHRPNGQFDAFNKAMLRGVAAGVGCSYESISKDYSQSNYSSSRLALIADRDNWRVLQKWLIQNFHQVVFEKWLDMAVLSGALSLPGYELTPVRYNAVKWMPRGWAWIDPEKEVRAYKEAIRGGLTTQTKVLAQEGEDVEELIAQRKREKELADAAGLTFDTDASVNKYTSAPNGSSADTGDKPTP